MILPDYWISWYLGRQLHCCMQSEKVMQLMSWKTLCTMSVLLFFSWAWYLVVSTWQYLFFSPHGPSQSLAAAVQCWFLHLSLNSMKHMWQRCPYLWHCYQTLGRDEQISQVTPGMFTLFNRNSPSIQSNHVRPWQNHCLLPLRSSQGPAITDTSDVIKRPTEGLCEPDCRRWMIAFMKMNIWR